MQYCGKVEPGGALINDLPADCKLDYLPTNEGSGRR
jgi:hypothetical protein